MIKISIVCVGKIKEKFFRDAIEEYSKRLGRYTKLNIIEVTDEMTPDGASASLEDQIREKEGARILAKLPQDALIVALEIAGKTFLPKNLRHGLKIALSEEKAISALSLADRLVCIQVSVRERIWP